MKYKVKITHTETFTLGVVVDAPSPLAAREMVSECWNKEDYLYDKCTDCPDSTHTNVETEGPATEFDEKAFVSI